MNDRFVVVGAGTMGLGIAYVAAGAGHAVELVEVDAARGATALTRLADLWERAVQRGKLTANEAAANRERVTLRPSLAEVAPAPGCSWRRCRSGSTSSGRCCGTPRR